MSREAGAVSLDEQRSRLKRRASVIRARLLRTIDALDMRRQHAQELGHHAKRLAVPVASTMIGAFVIGAGMILAVRALVVRRRERAFSYRLSRAIAPFRGATRPTLWREVSLRVVLIVTSELARRGAKLLLRERLIAPVATAAEGHSHRPGLREAPLEEP